MTTPTSPMNSFVGDVALVLSPLRDLFVGSPTASKQNSSVGDVALVLSSPGDLYVGSPRASKLVDYPTDLEEAINIIEQLKEENEKLKQENESYKVNQENVQAQYMKLLNINNRLHSIIEQTKEETEKLKRENAALFKSSI
jgi:hypothetical protein